MKPKISLSMIVKASDDEAILLERCLKYVEPFVDEINITITGENKACEDICKSYNAKVTHFDWVKDFSKARNYNFSQATGDYILWLDADDVLKNAHLLRETVEEMQKNHIDTVIVPYLYDFDDQGLCTVRHLKTRIVKNDGCVTWVGAVHEDFHSNREIKQFLDEKIEVLHITDEKRAKESSDRNLEIALKTFSDAPQDPRSHYLVANAYLAKHDNENALKYLGTFLETSQSDEEKYLAYLNMSDIVKEGKDSYIEKAWAIRPTYPNAYFKMGELLYKKGDFKNAKNFIELGLQMPRPDDSIIVFNPREYDYVPLSLMINICFELGEYTKALATIELIEKIYPKDKVIKAKKKAIENELGDVLKADEVLEKAKTIKDKKYLKKFLDKLSPELKAHPKICFFRNENFIKETSSGKDVVFYCSYTSKEWTPENVEKGGVGGSEESVINIAKNLKKLGWNVTVYNNCGKGGIWDGVTYKPWWSYNVRDKQDVTIIWRHPKTVDFLDERAGKIFVDMHDVVQDGEFTKERLEKINKVFVKSMAHRILFPSVPDDKVEIIPNGIDLSLFDFGRPDQNCEYCGGSGWEGCDHTGACKTDPCRSQYNCLNCNDEGEGGDDVIAIDDYLIINTSSPDRHLDTTLDIIEELIKRQPEKPWKLAWYYGWDIYDSVNKDNKEMMDWKEKQVARYEKLRSEGRFEGGTMLSHTDIARKYLEAGIFLYPTQFYEIHCISALKAQIAGCKVITSDFAALNETVKRGIKIHTDGKKWGKESTFGDNENTEKYIKAIIEGKQTGDAPNDVDWKDISKKWNENINK